jgi:large subunit ribosomal protein L17
MGQRIALRRNLCAALILHDKIITTEQKAKTIQGEVEKLISLARRGDLHARRLALAALPETRAVEKLFDLLGPRYRERTTGPGSQGGYTRLHRLGIRKGDGAALAQIELVP